jgi:hypothetical protein
MKASHDSDSGYDVILVRSTGHAIHIEKVLARSGILCKLIPVPRHLGSDCGVCVRIQRASKAATLAALDAANVEIESIHDV